MMDNPAFSTDVDITTQTILLHASNHDLEALKPLLQTPGAASVQDPESGTTPLHAAIAACGPAKTQAALKSQDSETQTNGTHDQGDGDADTDNGVDIEKAKDVVKELFLSGAIWNDLDRNNETPGCLAWRLRQKELYEMVVEAGLRAELLMNLMGGYEPLVDNDEEAGEDDAEGESNGQSMEVDEGPSQAKSTLESAIEAPSHTNPVPNPNEETTSSMYLSRPLTFPSTQKILDSFSNGVMMSWEEPIMLRTVTELCPPPPGSVDPSSPSTAPRGPRVLNIGFGLGLIDTFFTQLKPPPSSHHIIEAHPSILALLALPNDVLPAHTPSAFKKFNVDWQIQPQNHLHAGKWQEILPKFLNPPAPASSFMSSPLDTDTARKNSYRDEDGSPMQFDAIFFDTFAEPYSSLKEFFTEYVPGLLAENGKLSFFMGCGADRRVCYDVYTRVVECDLLDAGLGVRWNDMDIPPDVAAAVDGEEKGTQANIMNGEKEKGEGEGQGGTWDGVKRKYFDVDIYRLPVCEFLG